MVHTKFENEHFLFISVIIYVISLIIPVHLSDNLKDSIGFLYLLLGWMSFPYLSFFCWLGNLTLIIGWIFYRKKIGFSLSVISIALMSLYGINHFFQLNVIDSNLYEKPLFGYWFWFFSSIFLFIYQYNEKFKVQSVKQTYKN